MASAVCGILHMASNDSERLRWVWWLNVTCHHLTFGLSKSWVRQKTLYLAIIPTSPEVRYRWIGVVWPWRSSLILWLKLFSDLEKMTTINMAYSPIIVVVVNYFLIVWKFLKCQNRIFFFFFIFNFSKIIYFQKMFLRELGLRV